MTRRDRLPLSFWLGATTLLSAPIWGWIIDAMLTAIATAGCAILLPVCAP